MDSPAPSFYVVIGTPGCGRRALVLDLAENGLAAEADVLVLVPGATAEDPVENALAARPRTEVRRWSGSSGILPAVTPAAGASVFLLLDPLGDVLDQLEALRPWLAERGAELARILVVVDCQLAERTPALALWYDACIHFADAVFLARREGVANKWMSDFVRRYEEQAYPCYFLPVRKAGIANPALVLEPQPRRMSQYFDPQDELPEDLEIETDDEEPEETEDGPRPEPYFERNRAGRRVREVPALRAHLPA
jgi:hypothetical protein